MVIELFNVRRREGSERGIGWDKSGLRWAGFQNDENRYCFCSLCNKKIGAGWTCMTGRNEEDLLENRYLCDEHISLCGPIGVVQKGKFDPLLAEF
jgi:hypothetical protein